MHLMFNLDDACVKAPSKSENPERIVIFIDNDGVVVYNASYTK